jgi:hypothetical protein
MSQAADLPAWVLVHDFVLLIEIFGFLIWLLLLNPKDSAKNLQMKCVASS